MRSLYELCHCLFKVKKVLTNTKICYAFLSFVELFIVVQQVLCRSDLIHISMISDMKVQC